MYKLDGRRQNALNFGDRAIHSLRLFVNFSLCLRLCLVLFSIDVTYYYTDDR